MRNAVKDGLALHWENNTGALVRSGAVVPVGGVIVGVAVADIAPGELGALIPDGIYRMAAVANEAIPVGAVLSYDGVSNTLSAAVAGTVPAVAIATTAKAAGESEINAYFRLGGFGGVAGAPSQTLREYDSALVAGALDAITLPFTVIDPANSKVFYGGDTLRENIDYTLVGNTLTFTFTEFPREAGDRWSGLFIV